MKIFAAGLITETNTFCPMPTAIEDFRIQRGRELIGHSAQHPDLDLWQTWGRLAEARGDVFTFSLMAWAQPAGVTVRSAYEALREEILSDLRSAMPVDAVLLNLHGAMIASGYDDCEEDMIQRVRAIVGTEVAIGVEFDPHCHLSSTKIASADVVVIYKEYPHTDINERAAELFDLTVATRLGAIHPTMALFDCQMVGLYPTSREPLRRFVDSMIDAEKSKRALSVSFAHGFQFGDVAHMGAKMLVITDNDLPLAERTAQAFGHEVYRMRQQIGFDSLSRPMDEALETALRSGRLPVVVADQSDNPGGGAPGDATFALRWLLDRGVDRAAMGIFYDPEVVRIARKAGIGASLPVRLGGKIGRVSGDPVDCEVFVIGTADDYLHEFPQRFGPPAYRHAGHVVALRVRDIDIVVASARCQCMSPSIFADLGIDLSAKRLIVVKSAQHFYGAFAPLAGEVIYMSAPGAVPPDPHPLRYEHVNTARLYPWAADPLALEAAPCKT